MISCFISEMSRTISDERPSKMSSSIRWSVTAILRSTGDEASTQVSTILPSGGSVPATGAVQSAVSAVAACGNPRRAPCAARG